VRTSIFTTNDRKSQLGELAGALGRLVPVASELGLSQASDYVAALARTNSLLAMTPTQEELSELARSIPDVVYRHKDWESGLLVRKPDGSTGMPDWFERLEAVLQPVLAAALKLREIGYY
jgi:hypothetical protein